MMILTSNGCAHRARPPATVADLNDAFRRSMTGGRVVMTEGVSALDPAKVAHLLRQVAAFDAFTADNDPYGEHDFGSLDLDGALFLEDRLLRRALRVRLS